MTVNLGTLVGPSALEILQQATTNHPLTRNDKAVMFWRIINICEPQELLLDHNWTNNIILLLVTNGSMIMSRTSKWSLKTKFWRHLELYMKMLYTLTQLCYLSCWFLTIAVLKNINCDCNTCIGNLTETNFNNEYWTHQTKLQKNRGQRKFWFFASSFTIKTFYSHQMRQLNPLLFHLWLL